MPGTQPLSRDALRRLIGDKNYWNSSDPEFEARQRSVRTGFEKLYSTPSPPPESVSPDTQPTRDEIDRAETIRQLQERWNEVFEEYGRLTADFSYPVPANVERRKQEFERERLELERELERYGERPGVQFKM